MIVREPLKLDSEFSLVIVLVIVVVTVIIQSEYVPLSREFKVMVLLPEIADVVIEEQEPP